MYIYVCICLHKYINICMYICMCAKLLQPCLTLHNVTDCSLPRSSVHGVSQARILEWVAIVYSRDICICACIYIYLNLMMKRHPLNPAGNHFRQCSDSNIRQKSIVKFNLLVSLGSPKRNQIHIVTEAFVFWCTHTHRILWKRRGRRE